MKVKLEISNAGRRLHEGTYGIDDNQSFGAACADVWVKDPRVLPSIGALMVTMHESVLDELNRAEIKLKKL
jgi:hypothetical protein